MGATRARFAGSNSSWRTSVGALVDLGRHHANAAAELVRAGKLGEAEQAARDLLLLFPDVHDGYDRLGMVYEARGENRQAADCYRKVIAFVREHPNDYEPGFEEVFVKLVDRLDPPTAT
jgi:hypothetical protein